MNNQEPDLNQTPAETDSAKTNESVQRERSELPVDQRSSYLRSRQIARERTAGQLERLPEPLRTLDQAKKPFEVEISDALRLLALAVDERSR